jgi:hypothetical protein
VSRINEIKDLYRLIRATVLPPEVLVAPVSPEPPAQDADKEG